MSRVFQGTELKLNVHIEPIGELTMDDYHFRVEVICGTFKKQSLTIDKEQAIRVDGSNYAVCFDTSSLGTGSLKCRITAEIPDSDFEDGYRTEITEVDAGIDIINTIQ